MAAEWTASAGSTMTCLSRSSSASAAPAPPPVPAFSPAGGAVSGGTSRSSPSAASCPKLSKPPSPRSPSRRCPSSTSVIPPGTTRSAPTPSPRCSAPPRIWSLDPVEFSMVLVAHPSDQHVVPVVVPSFARAKSIRLSVDMLPLTPPALDGGGFPALERLSITNSRLDADALISRCPHLRVLELINCWGLGTNTITIKSATIEELLVMDDGLLVVDIVAPVLKKLTLHSSLSAYFSMSLLAPLVEDLSLNCTCLPSSPDAVGIDGVGMWCLDRLKFGTEEDGFVLGLELQRVHSVTHMRNSREMFQLSNISALELCVKTRGHVYGAMALNLLRICNATRRLKLFVHPVFWWTDNEACPPNCPCNQPRNWRKHNISLTSLEELEIENFKGSGHEVDFLKLLFRCAPLVNVTLKLASKVVASSRGCKETYNIFKDNPAVKYHVYHKRGKEVIYA